MQGTRWIGAGGWMIAAAVTATGWLIAGCSSGPDPLADNSGRIINVADGEQLKEQHLLGKWDLDGERTNTANGNPGVTAIPSDIVKDVLGKGWRFRPGGELRTDAVVGSKPGTWAIEGTNALKIKEYGSAEPQTFHATMRDGYLYLKDDRGKHLVFERDKFFGF